MSRVAIVTGGGSGIGQAVCQGLAQQGRHVAVLDVDASAAAQTANTLDAGGTRAVAIQVDVADRSPSIEPVTTCAANLVRSRFS